MQGLYKATGYWNTVEAKKDWLRIEKQATELGLASEAEELKPGDGDGWRTIDKRIAKLRVLIQATDRYCKCANPVYWIKPDDAWVCDKCGLPQE